MANQSGIVKDLRGGGATAVDSLKGESRTLNIGDIVYQNEKILTGETTEITITQNDGKDITLTSKDTLTLDQSSTINESFSNETVSNLSTLQQAILNETNLNSLEDTAAGAGAGTATTQDGISLSSVGFIKGGHISNVNADIQNLNSIKSSDTNSVNLDIGKYNIIISDNNTSTPSEPTPSEPTTGKTIKIPLSAYNDEQVPNSFDANNTNLLKSFYDNIKDILDKYTITRFPDGRDYLVPNKGANEFDYKDGWYMKKDGNLMMGGDNPKDLVVTNEDKSSNYADDGLVKVVNPNKELNIFGSDTANKITVDGAHINEIYAGVGEDNITVNNGAEITHDLNTGSGNDKVLVTGKESKVDRVHLRDGEDKIEVSDEAYIRDIKAGKGNDTVNVNNSKVNNIDGNDGDDIITLDNNSKSSVVWGEAGNDTITIKNSNVSNEVDGNDGNDTIRVENSTADGVKNSAGNGNIHVSGSNIGYMQSGDGDDNITVDSKSNVGNIFAGDGDNVIKVSGEGTRISDVYGYSTFKNFDHTKSTLDITVEGGASADTIYGSGKNDTIKIAGEKTYVNKIESNGGDDTITVGKGATTSHKFENEGNSGKLHIEEDIIDFSNVKQITNVKLGGADNNVNLKLTAEDIFRNNNLVIDGELGDRLDLVGSGLSKGESQDGYTTYSGKYVDEFGVTTDVGLRVKDEVHVDL